MLFSSSGRKSYPGSRKGSREKTHQLAEQELARVLREQERSIRSSDSGDKRSWSSGEQTSEDRRCKCGSTEDNKEVRSYSLADQEWRRDFVTGQFSKKIRSISAGSPEGLKDFRPRRMSPVSPRDGDDTSKDIGSFEDNSESKEIDFSTKGVVLDIIKESCTQGLEESDDMVVTALNGSDKTLSQVIKEGNDNVNTSSKDEQKDNRGNEGTSDSIVQRKSPSSFLRRLKNLSERFSKTSVELSSPKSSVDHSIVIPASPASLKSHKVDTRISLECDRKAMTLPKTSKKKNSLKRERGWKGLLKSKASVDREEKCSPKEEDRICEGSEARGGEERVANGLTPPEEISGEYTFVI